MTLHTILVEGVMKCIIELPEEPECKVNCAGTHACTCADLAFENCANRDVVDGYDDNCPHRYKSKLESAKNNAIPYEDQEFVSFLIRVNPIGTELKEGQIYSFDYKGIVKIEYYVYEPDNASGWMIISEGMFNAINANPDNAQAILREKNKTKKLIRLIPESKEETQEEIFHDLFRYMELHGKFAEPTKHFTITRKTP